ncbi:hypothetical protein [Candidatus Electronema sp. PJ]|uniref:hypothetical protein n=1 Tax=Candidatus Electronema sp. PJ TaxID=3401572 RepID=UPI003AA99AE1
MTVRCNQVVAKHEPFSPDLLPCLFAKEFGSARKELYSAKEEFGLAKLLSC